jgi:hypothetical protein
MNNDLLKEIKELWFKDHVATYTRYSDDLKVLEWKKPDSIEFGVRYVMDRHNLYITGDLYSAMFSLSQQANLESLGKYDMYYFCSKLTTMVQEKAKFNGTLAVQELEEKREELIEDGGYEEKEVNSFIDELIGMVNNCSSERDWINELNYTYSGNYDDFCMLEWVYDIGLETSPYLLAYVTGLQMAYQQLFVNNQEEEVIQLNEKQSFFKWFMELFKR